MKFSSEIELRETLFNGFQDIMNIRLSKYDFNPNLFANAFEWKETGESKKVLCFNAPYTNHNTYNELRIYNSTKKKSFLYNENSHTIYLVMPSFGKIYIEDLPYGVLSLLNNTYDYEEFTLYSHKQKNGEPGPLDILEINYSAESIKRQRLIDIEEQRRKEREEIEAVKAKLLKKKRREELEKMALRELMDEGILFPEAGKRPPIPKDVVDAVWRRDGGKCVYCGSTENLQLDHIIPFSKGGATTVENLQLLCQKCNLQKSNKIG